MMKASLMLVALLFIATTAQAQHHAMPSTVSGPSYIYDGWGGGFGGYGGLGSIGGTSVRQVAYEAPRNFAIGYVKNDGDTAVSTFMNYEDALALGQKQIAESELVARGEAMPSLGEVARAFRAVKVPTLRLQSRVTQDDSGNLQICNLNGNNCRRP
jgi:hypothetical protein